MMLNPLPDTAMPAMVQLTGFVRQWEDIALCTDPTKRTEAEASLKSIYTAAGLEAPQRIVWSGSPFAQGLVRAIVLDPALLELLAEHTWTNVINRDGSGLQPTIAESFRNSMRLFDVAAVKESLFDAVKDAVRKAATERWSARMTPLARTGASTEVWDGVWAGVWDSIGDSVRRGIEAGMRQMNNNPDKSALTQCIDSCLKGAIGDSVKEKVWEIPMDAAWTNVRNAVSSQLRVQAWDGIWKVIQASVWQNVAVPIGEHVKGCDNNSAQSSGYGQHDAYWLAFYAYFKESHGLVKETDPVSALMDLARTAGWFAPHQHICWVCERPRTLSRDEQGRLHAIDGPALTYPDGWNIHVNAGTLRSPGVLQAV